MKVLNIIKKYINPIFKVFGVGYIIIALLYAFDLIEPTNYKFDLVINMLFIGLILFLSEYTPSEDK